MSAKGTAGRDGPSRPRPGQAVAVAETAWGAGRGASHRCPELHGSARLPPRLIAADSNPMSFVALWATKDTGLVPAVTEVRLRHVPVTPLPRTRHVPGVSWRPQP